MTAWLFQKLPNAIAYEIPVLLEIVDNHRLLRLHAAASAYLSKELNQVQFQYSIIVCQKYNVIYGFRIKIKYYQKSC